MTPDLPQYSIVGGGLAGALMAVYLGKAGRSVELFERRPDPASGTIIGGRSINLAISVRGIHALEQVGLADRIMKLAIPMRGRMIHSVDGHTHFQPYDKDPQRCINSISRGGLNAALIDAARECANVRVQFDWKCTDVDLDAPALELAHAVTGEMRRAPAQVVLGIDGAFSAVRRSMQRLDRFNYSHRYLSHGYKELTIPPKAGGGFALEPNALHIWPRRSFMMIALPNPDGSFTCTMFLRFEGPDSFGTLRAREDARRFFEQNFADALPLMPTLLEDFERNPVGSMMTVRCGPWSHAGKVALAGDAAHAVVPFYGQGMNASFEDCAALFECLTRHNRSTAAAFEEYEQRRKANSDALADLAIVNFLEMRDKTASRLFHARKKLERTLHKWLPGLYTPLYTMVSFTRTPYADARRRAKTQDVLVGSIAGFLAAVLLAVFFHLVCGVTIVGALAEGALLTILATAAYRTLHDRDRTDARENGALLP